jgi:hypothetical protein
MIRLVAQVAALALALIVSVWAALSAYESFARLGEPVRIDTAGAVQKPANGPATAEGKSIAHPPLSTYETTIARPVFFEGRRYPAPQKPAAVVQTNVEAAPVQAVSLAGAKLRGVALADGTARALIEMPGLPAIWMAQGEAVEGWRLDSVDSETAKLNNGRSVAILSLYAPLR